MNLFSHVKSLFSKFVPFFLLDDSFDFFQLLGAEEWSKTPSQKGV